MQPSAGLRTSVTGEHVVDTQDTITGFLLAGVGNIDTRKKSNYLAVDSSEFITAFRTASLKGISETSVYYVPASILQAVQLAYQLVCS